MMNVLITGGTGFIGSALCASFNTKGYKVVVKTRRPNDVSERLRAVDSLSQIAASEYYDVVINLAGEPIADKRWSPAQRQKILASRLNATEELMAFFHRAETKPAVFISASAIGYYGTGISDEGIGEDGRGDDSFSSSLCGQWEEAALQAKNLGIRTCLLRIGIVLGRNGGVLGKMLLPFKMGLGGKIGSGKQWMPWIHLDDLVGIVDYCIEHQDINGPVNCTAPYPVVNSQFTAALGKQLKRPTIFSMPAFIVKQLMGTMGEELLLSGKKVLPIKIQQAGYQFSYEQLETALKEVLGK